jgi:hypothetical protein
VQCGAELKGVERPERMKPEEPRRKNLDRLDVDDHVTGADELLESALALARG